MRSARPSTTSRDRGPITASGRTTRKRKAERQREGEGEARQRAADRSLARVGVVDEMDPRARPDRREEEIGIRLREVLEQEEIALEQVESAMAKLLVEKLESTRL
jgi:hypothetical protein